MDEIYDRLWFQSQARAEPLCVWVSVIAEVTVGGIKQGVSFFISHLHHIFAHTSTHKHAVPIPCIPCAPSEAGFQERGTLIELSFYGLPGVGVCVREGVNELSLHEGVFV